MEAKVHLRNAHIKTHHYIDKGHKIFIRFIQTLYMVDFGQNAVPPEALLQRQ